MERVKVGDDTVYQDDSGILLVTNKAQGWFHFPEPLTRKRTRAYAKAIKMAKHKCGLNDLSLVDGIRIEDGIVYISGDMSPMQIPSSEADISDIWHKAALSQ